MDKNALVKELQELVQAEIDTSHTYDRVLDEISDKIVRGRLETFRDSHMAHIAAVSEEIRKLEGEPPKLSRDFKGYVIEAFSVLWKVAGMKSALKALKTAENITCRYYEQVIPKDLPPFLKELLRKHFSDEKSHLEYIENNLKAL
jgi:rubrerythrin